MKLMQNRYYWTQDKKTKGTHRILWLGDSILLGTGVTYFETLSYKLEEYLNRKVYAQEIEVVNFSSAGFSIYDEWLEYLRIGENLEPDMVIITISSHDAEFFRLPEGSKGVEHFWDADSINLQYFKLIIKEISDFSKINKLSVIITFCDYFVPIDLKKKAYSKIMRLCEENNLDFLNISNCIEEDFLYTDNEKLYISKVDRHPSAYAIERAANRLGEYILNKGYLNNNEEFILPKNLLINAEESRQNGNKPEIVLYRLRKLLTDKYHKKPFMPNDEFLYSIEEIKNISKYNVALLFIEAYAEILNNDSNRILTILYNAYVSFGRLSKNFYFHEHNLVDNNLKYFPSKRIKGKNFNPKIVDSLSSKLAQWLWEFYESKDRFFKKQTTSFDELSGFINDLNIRSKKAQLSISDLWDNIIILITQFLELLSSLKLLINKYQPTDYSKEPWRTFLGLTEEAITTFDGLETLIGVLHLKKIVSLKNFDIVDKPVANCVVHIRSNVPKAYVVLQLESKIPNYRLIRASHWLLNDGKFHSCQFQFSLFTLGKIEITIHGQGDIDFEYMKIYINENRQITLKKENFTQVADNRYDSGFIFNTI